MPGHLLLNRELLPSETIAQRMKVELGGRWRCERRGRRRMPQELGIVLKAAADRVRPDDIQAPVERVQHARRDDRDGIPFPVQ